MTGVSAPENARSYDLCLRTSSSGLLSLERGITLADDRLEWTVGERADAARLGAIVEVRLQTGGVPTRPSSLCRIQLNDGYALGKHARIAALGRQPSRELDDQVRETLAAMVQAHLRTRL